MGKENKDNGFVDYDINTNTSADVLHLDGLLISSVPLKLVQKEKVILQNSNNNGNGEEQFYYNVGVTNGQKIIMCTAGKKVEAMELYADYEMSFNYIGNKLKIVDFRRA